MPGIDEPDEQQPFSCQLCDETMLLVGIELDDTWTCQECGAEYRYEKYMGVRMVVRLHP